jgi:hypothetical protein
MSYLVTHTLEKTVPALEKTAQAAHTLEKIAPARTLEETAQAARALEAMKAVDAFRPARTFTRTLPASQPASQSASEASKEKEPEQIALRSSQQAKGKDQAALYCGSPTCSVSAGAVTPA